MRVAALTAASTVGNTEAVRTLALEILDEAPGQREALGALFNILRGTTQLAAAGIIIDRLATVHLNDGVSRALAAQFFLQQANLPKALLHGRMLIRLAPEAIASHFIMGRVFLATHNAQAAEHHLRTALTLPAALGPAPSSIEIKANLAVALRDQGRLDEAREMLTEVAAVAQPTAEILITWAGIEEAAKDFDNAAALLDQALKMWPDNPHAKVARAALYRRTHEPARGLQVLEELTGGLQTNNEVGDDVNGLLQKGQILDSMERYDEAFEAFNAYKSALRLRTGHEYLADQAKNTVEGLREFFTAGRSRLLPRAGVRADFPQPIFIVGFPRSGTTLVEQILCSHHSIAAGDELPIINSLADRAQMLLGSPLPYPKALSELWLGDRAGHVEMLRDLYLSEATRHGAVDPGKPWFTDKMPLNEMHLGLISILFPESPIIHLIRHPLDVVFSVFSNALTHGFYCAYSLESAAQHYTLVAGLVAQYRKVISSRYLAVRYENVVSDPENEVHRILAEIGLPFDSQVLKFYENDRFARTASYAQVTEPLYERSKFRYKNYIRHLHSVSGMLEPEIKRLGYSLE